MPSTSEKQKRLMAAVANNPKFAKKVGIPQSVGKEFEREDKKMNCGSKRKPTAMKKGGMMKRAPRGSKGPAYDAMLDREEARKAKARRERAEGKAEPSEAVQTMRRQQKDLDSRMADMPMMRKGGKVRGCGMAKKGVRPAKMM